MGEATTGESTVEPTILPTELVILIFDNSDQDTLVKCGLVCRQWLSLTRPTLFSHLVLEGKLLNSLILDWPDLFNDPLCTISPLVNTVTIVSEVPNELRQVIPRLKSLVNAKTLHLRNQTLFFAYGNFPASFIVDSTAFRGLTILNVGFDFRNFSQMAAFICSFPLLEDLRLFVDWEGPAIYGSHTQISAHLRSLSIKCNARYILDWMLTLPRVPIIKDLIVAVEDVSDVPILGEFLERQGPDLQSFTWIQEPSLARFPLEKYISGIDLSLNTQLQYIGVNTLEFPRAETPVVYQLVRSLLSQVVGLCLREVSLDLPFFALLDIYSESIGDMLVNLSPSLSDKVILRVKGEQQLDDECFESWRKQGILVVVC